MVRAESLPQRGAGRDERSIDALRRSVNGSSEPRRRERPARTIGVMPSIPGQPADTSLMERLRDRVCLVTGSTGIAAASARRLAAEGASVFVVSRTAEHARALADELEALGGDGRLVGRRPDDRGRGRRGDRRGRDPLRPDRRPVRCRRRKRPPVRRRPDPRAEPGRLGPDARAEPAQPGAHLSGRRPPDAGPAAEQLGHARLDPADGQRHRQRPGARVLRDPRLRGGEGRDDRADDHDGRDLRRRPDPRQRGRAGRDGHADGRPGKRRRTDPRVQPEHASRLPAR